jgi:hypothetical protein
MLCSIHQRYNSKAIHNIWVFNLIEIKGCVQYIKDTIRKQFTTDGSMLRSPFIFIRCVQYIKDTIRKQFTTWISS